MERAKEGQFSARMQVKMAAASSSSSRESEYNALKANSYQPCTVHKRDLYLREYYLQLLLNHAILLRLFYQLK